MRTDEEYKAKEREQQKETKAKMRKVEQYNAKEREQQKEAKAKKKERGRI